MSGILNPRISLCAQFLQGSADGSEAYSPFCNIRKPALAGFSILIRATARWPGAFGPGRKVDPCL